LGNTGFAISWLGGVLDDGSYTGWFSGVLLLDSTDTTATGNWQILLNFVQTFGNNYGSLVLP
jgi:hypothetical protein